MEEIRLNKYLSEMGICSRREADRYVEEGRITVNGRPAELGQKITETDELLLDGKKIGPEQKDAPVLIAFNKPRGIVCTTSSKDRATNIIEFIDYPVRIFPIGRLDKESEGIILLTNQGELVNLINRQRYGHEKEYIVRCRRKLTNTFLKQMSEGVEITIPVIDASDKDRKKARGREYVTVTTKPCKVTKLDDHSFDIILTQGMNRQIRRMCDALGNYVDRLKRIRVMNIELKDLPEGQYRDVTPEEYRELKRLIEQDT